MVQKTVESKPLPIIWQVSVSPRQKLVSAFSEKTHARNLTDDEKEFILKTDCTEWSKLKYIIFD
jgi:hypothetical protein